MAYKIEIYENPLNLTDWEFEKHLCSLPIERRAKVLSYRNKIDRNLSLLAYILLRQGLQKWYSISQDEHLRFEYNQNEKPSLVDYPHIHSNISHCHEAVVCAFSSRSIGVDVEGLIDYDSDLLHRVANTKEYHTIINAKDSTLEFTILWTKKESYLKMTGIGLVDDLHTVLNEKSEINSRFTSTYSQNKKYVLCICESI